MYTYLLALVVGSFLLFSGCSREPEIPDEWYSTHVPVIIVNGGEKPITFDTVGGNQPITVTAGWYATSKTNLVEKEFLIKEGETVLVQQTVKPEEGKAVIFNPGGAAPLRYETLVYGSSSEFKDKKEYLKEDVSLLPVDFGLDTKAPAFAQKREGESTPVRYNLQLVVPDPIPVSIAWRLVFYQSAPAYPMDRQDIKKKAWPIVEQVPFSEDRAAELLGSLNSSSHYYDVKLQTLARWGLADRTIEAIKTYDERSRRELLDYVRMYEIKPFYKPLGEAFADDESAQVRDKAKILLGMAK